MSSQSRLENVLRDIHVMISKSETYDTDRIIVSKQDIFNLIDRLNASIYEIMDEYELTQQSRDRALREKKKEGDKIIWDASRQAEDIYAASVLYTEEALNHLNVMVDEADATVDRMYREFCKNIKQQQETIRENQLELKSQLQLLADTEKYLRLIEERNREIERERAEKKGRKTLESFGEKHAAIKPEIKINEEYFRKAGIPFENEDEKPSEAEEIMQPLEDEGVIESTLKKAAEDIQQIFKDDKNPENEKETAQKAAENKKYPEEKHAEGQISAEEAADSHGNSAKEAAGSHSNLAEGAAGGYDNSAKATADGYDNTGDKSAEDYKKTAGTSLEDQEYPAKKMEGYVLQDSERQAADDVEIKVNLDAEYFRQKEDETDENKKQHHEKLSLLDKLMGKKKTLL